MSSYSAQSDFTCLDMLHNSEMLLGMEIEQMHGFFMTLQVSSTVVAAKSAVCVFGLGR